VASESFNGGGGFGFDSLTEPALVGVVGAGEHKILPDHEPELVAEAVEAVGFVKSSAPDPDEVYVCVVGLVE